MSDLQKTSTSSMRKGLSSFVSPDKKFEENILEVLIICDCPSSFRKFCVVFELYVKLTMGSKIKFLLQINFINGHFQSMDNLPSNLFFIPFFSVPVMS